MLDRIVKKLGKIWYSEDKLGLSTPKDYVVSFKLSFQDLLIGELSHKEGIWIFHYSPDFKKQDKIKPLINFPNSNKVYYSKELYPFFVHRIPGLKQPKIQDTIKKENINPSNEAELLKKFGRHSISNPFQLVAV